MPINLELHENFDGTLDGRYKQGNKPAPSSGGTPALAWSAPQGFGDGNTLTITTDGTYDFGNVGPNIVMLIDLANYGLGAASGAEIRQGASVISLTGGTFTIEAEALLPSGKGLVMGDGMQSSRIICRHSPSTKLFESVDYILPADHIETARAQNNTDWQIKPTWNQSNFKSGNEGDPLEGNSGTNFFTTRVGLNGASSGNQKSGWYISTNNAYTFYPSGMPAMHNTSDPNNWPYPDVYTHENFWDQGSADGITLDASLDSRVTTSNGVVNHRQIDAGLRLSAEFAPDKIIDSFTYPGFIRGYTVSNDAHILDGGYYRSIGDGAPCRVVLANHPDFFQASKFTILWINSWTPTEIQAEQRHGWFDLNDLSGLFLCIIGASNTQIGSIAL